MVLSRSKPVECLNEYIDNYLHDSIPSEFSYTSPPHGTSPIGRLPTELLEEIIWLSAGEESMPQPRYCILSRVSPPWRQIIIGNPSFWLSVDLSWPPEFLGMILSRAGSLLKLSFRYIGPTSTLLPDREVLISHILAQYSHRVETLLINLESPVAKKCSEVSFPSLKNAIFDAYSSDSGLNSRIPFLHIAADLQALDISKCRVDLPWDQLFNVLRGVRQLKIRFNSRSGYTKFLSNSSSLINLQDLSVESLYGIDDDPDFEPRDPDASLLRCPTQEFILPSLETLCIHSFNMPTLMTRLRTPSLQHYEVRTRKYGSSHVLRRHLLPAFEDFDYSSIRSLYVGFHASCSSICILGSERPSLSDFSSSRSSHPGSSFSTNAAEKGFHIQLFHPPTVGAFLPKCLDILLPKLTNLALLSLKHHNAYEVSEVKTLVMLQMLKYKPNQCPKLETMHCRFPDGLPLRETSDAILNILEKRIEYGNGNLKYVCLENYSVYQVLVKEAGKLGISVTFSAPLPIC